MQPTDTNLPNSSRDDFGQVLEKIKSANNVLVTISSNPSVDQMAACIGFTLVLNKAGKHANAVFSGKVPPTIDFLKPEKTLETNTNSLRDFIIALDKSKADKLRYKVEDDVVKIFITPYRTSISEKDFKYSQGDFNIDLVIALGVQDKNHLDAAILANGRILHDAAVICINTDRNSRLGTINWTDTRASSLCEMAADISHELSNDIFDSQNATALLTGIVAETDRYSNEKAKPHTMSVASELMSAGASTQLVSTKLEEGLKATASSIIANQQDGEQPEDGVMQIDHDEEKRAREAEEAPKAKSEAIKSADDTLAQLDLSDNIPEEDVAPKERSRQSHIVKTPPQMGGRLTANSVPEESFYSGSTDPLSNMSSNAPMLSRNDDSMTSDPLVPSSDDSQGLPKGKTVPAPDDNQTLEEIEESVGSPHLEEESVKKTESETEAEAEAEAAKASLDEARDAVLRAQAGQELPPEARQDMGTNELGSNLNEDIEPEEPQAEKGTPPPVPPPFTPELPQS